MTILAGDIKLVASQVMADVPEGGGGPTSTLIQDGVSNNVFEDISELARGLGEVSIRKMFMHVQTDNRDSYLGANFIIAEPPNDPNVSITAFAADGFFEERDSAKSRLESYLAAGELYDGVLFGNHLKDQMTMTVLQQVGVRVPPVGATLVLKKFADTPGEVTQFVRLTSISSDTRTFYDGQGEFVRVVLTFTLGDRLRTSFPGFDAMRYGHTFSELQNRTTLYKSAVADAARYYGVVPLTQAANINDYVLRVKGIYTQLVPSTQVESPIADARTNQVTAGYAATGDRVTQHLNCPFGPSQRLFIGGAILPSSLTITSASGIALSDTGGILYSGSAAVGQIDYVNGIGALSADVFGGETSFAVNYIPAAVPEFVTQSFGIPVTTESRRLNYVLTLNPPPARGSVSASYLVAGQWYEMRDDGSGAVRPQDGSAGVGNLNSTTGTLSLTLGALPDDGSEIIIQYVEELIAKKYDAAALQGGARLAYSITPAHYCLQGSMRVSWTTGSPSVQFTASEGSSGEFSGAATGKNYGDHFTLSPDILPPAGTAFTLNYTRFDILPEPFSISGTVVGNSFQVNLGVGTSRVNSFFVYASCPSRRLDGVLEYQTERFEYLCSDDGQVLNPLPHGHPYISHFIVPAAVFNHSTGILTLPKTLTFVANVFDYETYEPIPGITATSVRGNALLDFSADLLVSMPVTGTKVTGSSTPVVGEVVTPTTLQLQAVVKSNMLLSGTRFKHGSQSYTATPRTDVLLKNTSPTTGIGEPCGTINESSGLITLDSWDAGVAPTISDWRAVLAPPTAGLNSPFLCKQIVFRTAAAPLRPSSMSLLGTTANGETFNVFANPAGVIAGTGVNGTCSYEAGLVSLEFSSPVLPETLRYNAVSYIYLPLDADIIGMDPVRLPTDGRVPIIRAGSVVVIGNTGKIGPVTVSNGQTLNCARTRLSRVRLLNSHGMPINAGYSANLEAGTVSFTDVSSYAQPVTLEHRIEDMALVADAQISGVLRLTRPLTHHYPAESSYVSSAMLMGNVFARVSNVFDQASWNGISWSSAQVGDAAQGTYNHALAPILVANIGAITERWALRFTSTTSFQIFGEHVGLVGTGTINADCSPVNPATGTPYFTVYELAWGLGWAVGNILRIDTVAAMVPIILVRTVQQGQEAGTNYSFSMATRGDVNRP